MRSEYEEQVEVFMWAESMIWKYPELWMLHSSLNGVRLYPKQRSEVKKAGAPKGFPDINLPIWTETRYKKYSGLYIELKREKGSYPTKDQKKWLSALSEQGYYACVCRGSKAAIAIITKYLEGEL